MTRNLRASPHAQNVFGISTKVLSVLHSTTIFSHCVGCIFFDLRWPYKVRRKAPSLPCFVGGGGVPARKCGQGRGVWWAQGTWAVPALPAFRRCGRGRCDGRTSTTPSNNPLFQEATQGADGAKPNEGGRKRRRRPLRERAKRENGTGGTERSPTRKGEGGEEERRTPADDRRDGRACRSDEGAEEGGTAPPKEA